ncbi:MAG: hypothetical protein HY318_09080 [Armatimonadetes bacterium]|nr:hypothetical protein [Armatimonadota bacterium]
MTRIQEGRSRWDSPKQSAALLMGILLLLCLPACWSASSFDDLRKEYPDFARLLTLAAPKSGLSKEQLDKAFDNIAKWALESKSQQVRDSIELLVDKGRLDYFEAMREAARKIKVDGDASEWPEWSCLWRATDSGEPTQDTDVTAFRALFDGERLGIAIDVPQSGFPPGSWAYWVQMDCAGTDEYDLYVTFDSSRKPCWLVPGHEKPVSLPGANAAVARCMEVVLPSTVTDQFCKEAIRLRFLGPRRTDQIRQTFDLLLPVDPGLAGAREMLHHATTGDLTASATLPTGVLDQLRETRGTLASMRQVGNLCVLLDDGCISRPVERGQDIHPGAVGKTGFDVDMAVRALLRACGHTPKHPEPFDFLVFLTNYPFYAMPQWAPAVGTTKCRSTFVRGTVHGIGCEPVNRRSTYGSFGRLQRWAAMMNVQLWRGQKDPSGWALPCIAHECVHQWTARVRFDIDPGPAVVPSNLLTDSGLHLHWSRFTPCRGSVMGWPVNAGEESDVYDLGDGEFELHPSPTEGLSDLDLYLMGLLPPEKVAPFFVVMNPDVKEPDLKIGQRFHGTRKDVTIQDIIAVEGPRIPDWQHSQKDFRAAFVLVTRGEMPADDEIKFVDNLRQEFEKYWFKATRGLSRMDTRLDASLERKQ